MISFLQQVGAFVSSLRRTVSYPYPTMKKLLAAPFALFALISHGQAYNNLQHYDQLNSLLGCPRPTVNARLAKAGYRVMTYQEVCQQEGEIISKQTFKVAAYYRYTGRSSSASPYLVQVAFDEAHGDKAAIIRWNEYMTKPGRGKELDAVLKLYHFAQIDETPGIKATTIWYQNALRNLAFTGFEGLTLIKFTLGVNRGDTSGQ